MTLDFGNLEIDRLIIHEVPRRISEQSTSSPLRVTDKESALDQTDKNFFAERIKEGLSRSACEIAFDPNSLSPVPKLAFKILSQDFDEKETFVSISQKIALHLYGCQTGVNPPGVLAIVQVKLSDKTSLAILKLEKEEGMQLELEEINGLITCNVKRLSELMMTGGKVFKIGFFIKEAEEFSAVTGYVSDRQNNEVARFFLDSFLGCYLLESSESKTKKFFTVSQEFINSSVEKPELKAQYEIALLSMIQSNQNILDPVSFAQQHLELADRQKFLDFLEREDIDLTSFEKNTTSIRNLIKIMHLSFAFGENDVSISISGKPSSFENVEIQQTKDNKVRVTFEAELGKVGK